MIGRSDLLDMRKRHRALEGEGARLLEGLLPAADAAGGRAATSCEAQDHGLDARARPRAHRALREPALDKRAAGARSSYRIRNAHRSVGAMLSGEVARRYGHEGLPDDTIHVAFKGIAGQSFGAFLAQGVTFELKGATNDYVGKGLSGGRIVVYPDPACPAKPEENIVIGNTVMYGAIAGEAYYRGVAGERFCVRNSGATAVVEGTGDHGCEYMTGGTVVVLGRTGRNFAAGMSGGIAYVFDADGTFRQRCNQSMCEILPARDRSRAGEARARARGRGQGAQPPPRPRRRGASCAS